MPLLCEQAQITGHRPSSMNVEAPNQFSQGPIITQEDLREGRVSFGDLATFQAKKKPSIDRSQAMLLGYDLRQKKKKLVDR